MFNSLVVVSIATLEVGTKLKSGHIVETDKNGEAPKIYNVIAGKAPNRTIQSGTVAKRGELENGHCYLMQVRETAPSAEYGRQYQWTKVAELRGLEIVDACQKLGTAEVFTVSSVDIDEQVNEAKAVLEAQRV